MLFLRFRFCFRFSFGLKPLALLSFLLLFVLQSISHAGPVSTALHSLENYVVDTPQMVSSGLPTKAHLETLKEMDVAVVIDLIPRNTVKESTDKESVAKEKDIVEALGLQYHNIGVDWHNPSVEDFARYASIMNKALQEDKKVLTHCQLNWRGAAFTYLYKVNELGISEKEAKKALLNIWQPNEVWQDFIDDVMAGYSQ